MDWGGGQGRGTKRCNIRKKEMGNETKKNAITEQKHAFPMTLALFSKPVNVHLPSARIVFMCLMTSPTLRIWKVKSFGNFTFKAQGEHPVSRFQDNTGLRMWAKLSS